MLKRGQSKVFNLNHHTFPPESQEPGAMTVLKLQEHKPRKSLESEEASALVMLGWACCPVLLRPREGGRLSPA